MDTVTIKQLEKMRDRWFRDVSQMESVDAGSAFTDQERHEALILDKVLTYIRTMGEIEAAATSMQIVFEDVGVLRKDYGRTDFRAEKFNGNDNSTFSDHTSLADAWGSLKQ